MVSERWSQKGGVRKMMPEILSERCQRDDVRKMVSER
jgi:hypothetical protein